jgi:hypothetical protein
MKKTKTSTTPKVANKKEPNPNENTPANSSSSDPSLLSAISNLVTEFGVQDPKEKGKKKKKVKKTSSGKEEENLLNPEEMEEEPDEQSETEPTPKPVNKVERDAKLLLEAYEELLRKDVKTSYKKGYKRLIPEKDVVYDSENDIQAWKKLIANMGGNIATLLPVYAEIMKYNDIFPDEGLVWDYDEDRIQEDHIKKVNKRNNEEKLTELTLEIKGQLKKKSQPKVTKSDERFEENAKYVARFKSICESFSHMFIGLRGWFPLAAITRDLRMGVINPVNNATLKYVFTEQDLKAFFATEYERGIPASIFEFRLLSQTRVKRFTNRVYKELAGEIYFSQYELYKKYLAQTLEGHLFYKTNKVKVINEKTAESFYLRASSLVKRRLKNSKNELYDDIEDGITEFEEIKESASKIFEVVQKDIVALKTTKDRLSYLQKMRTIFQSTYEGIKSKKLTRNQKISKYLLESKSEFFDRLEEIITMER